jgi:hypothetical protein
MRRRRASIILPQKYLKEKHEYILDAEFNNYPVSTILI